MDIKARIRMLTTKTLEFLIGDTERTVEYRFVFRNLQLERGRILDVGCASSPLALILAKSGFYIYAIDVRPYSGKHSNLKFYLCDSINTPFPDSFFDRIIAVSTIEHIGLGYYGDPRYNEGDLKAMRELNRVLKGDGKMLLTVPFAKNFCRLDSFERVYDVVRLDRLIEGFQIEKEEYYFPFRQFMFRGKVINMKWMRVSKAQAQIEFLGYPRPYAIACLLLRKA